MLKNIVRTVENETKLFPLLGERVRVRGGALRLNLILPWRHHLFRLQRHPPTPPRLQTPRARLRRPGAEAMLPFLGELWGNPSSIHHIGRQTRALLDDAPGPSSQAFGRQTQRNSLHQRRHGEQ